MDFVLPNRERFQRVVVFLPFVAKSLGPASRPERVRELGNGEDAFAVEFLALFFAHTRQQTEVILLDSLLAAPGLELALGAVPVQYKVRRRRAGQ